MPFLPYFSTLFKNHLEAPTCTLPSTCRYRSAFKNKHRELSPDGFFVLSCVIITRGSHFIFVSRGRGGMGKSPCSAAEWPAAWGGRKDLASGHPTIYTGLMTSQPLTTLRPVSDRSCFGGGVLGCHSTCGAASSYSCPQDTNMKCSPLTSGIYPISLTMGSRHLHDFFFFPFCTLRANTIRYLQCRITYFRLKHGGAA